MKNVTLTSAELAAMQAETTAEIRSRLGATPTLDRLIAAGEITSNATGKALDFIDNLGRVITLVIAETVQSVAALVIALVFAVLEYQRVYHGALALGQADTQAAWIALAVVCANFIVPIYVLKSLRGSANRTLVKPTLKSLGAALWQRITGNAQTLSVAWTHNPTLKASKLLITWTTVFLAVYDLLSPILISILENTATKPMPIMVIELIMGLGLSLGGVFFLQSAAHEIGLRTLTDRPAAAADVLKLKRAEYDTAADAIRQEIRAKHEAAKSDKMAARLGARQVSTPDQTATPDAAQVEKPYPIHAQTPDAAQVVTVTTADQTPDFLSLAAVSLPTMTSGHTNGHTPNGRGSGSARRRKSSDQTDPDRQN